MVGWWLVLMAVVIIIQRISELYIAKRNHLWAIAAGAQEFGARHYPLFFILHVGWLIGWIWESTASGSTVSEFWYLWFSLFLITQGLRYWCMVSLGRLWNTRILAISGSQAVCKGPYRFVAHPNYIAVAIELASVPLIFGATITAILATLLNAALILGIRIPEEKHALKLLKQVPSEEK